MEVLGLDETWRTISLPYLVIKLIVLLQSHLLSLVAGAIFAPEEEHMSYAALLLAQLS